MIHLDRFREIAMVSWLEQTMYMQAETLGAFGNSFGIGAHH
jgi:hypothetical protein